MRKYHSPKDYLDEAQDPTTSAERLDILSGVQWEFVLAAVADNPNTLPRTLRSITPRGISPMDDYTALAIARRRDASPQVLRLLARRFLEIPELSRRAPALQLGLELMANPSTPADAIAALTDPTRTTTHFRQKAAAYVRNPEALARLRGDVSERVRRNANALK